MKTCFRISLEEKKNEITGLYPEYLTQEITQVIMIKLIINTTTQIRDKTTNETQYQIEFER